MGHHRAALLGCQLRRLVEDVAQCAMQLADVMEQGDPLDAAQRSFIVSGGVADDQGIGCDPAHVGSGDFVVGVDGIEQGFEGRRA